MEQLVVSISHSNYLLKSSGTEKYIRELSSILLKCNIHHLNFFAFHNKVTKLQGFKLVGVILDGDFIGIFKYNSMLNIVKNIENKYQYKTTDIHLQHLKNHSLEDLSRLINGLGVPATIFLHDYFTICNRETMLSTENKFCGITLPSKEKCSKCKNIESGLIHKRKLNEFLYRINDNIASIIAPSKFVATHWGNAYKDFKEYVIVRPHTQLIEDVERKHYNDKIRIAYVGAQLDFKGFHFWKSLVKSIIDSNITEYEFYYFGVGKEIVDGVNNIYVSIAEQGENAMLDNLKKYNIDCAFLWPIWPETYSYVYYELYAGNVYILTNRVSGNICDEVLINNNGVVFSSYDECIELLKKTDSLKRMLKFYHSTHGEEYKQIVTNQSLSYIISPIFIQESLTQEEGKYPVRANSLMTNIYIKIHDLRNRKETVK